jgi:hypothetical protein
MAMGKRNRDRQPPMWVSTTDLPTAASHPFYRRLNQVLREYGFDNFAEAQCASFYAETMGRPGLPPGIYFRLLLIGYFEGIDSERGHRVARRGVRETGHLTGLLVAVVWWGFRDELRRRARYLGAKGYSVELTSRRYAAGF